MVSLPFIEVLRACPCATELVLWVTQYPDRHSSTGAVAGYAASWNKRDILNLLAGILCKVSEVFKQAVNAIIRFGTDRHKSFFSPSEASDIKNVMQKFGETTDRQKMVGEWLCGYAESLQPFDETKHRHTLNEVDDVAEGKYDWKIERIVHKTTGRKSCRSYLTRKVYVSPYDHSTVGTNLNVPSVTLTVGPSFNTMSKPLLNV